MDILDTIARIRLDTRLKSIEKLLFLFLVDLASESGSVHLPMRVLEKETGISVAAISVAIPRMRDAGYIRASKLPQAESGHVSYLIYIAEQPMSTAQSVEFRLKGVRVRITIEDVD